MRLVWIVYHKSRKAQILFDRYTQVATLSHHLLDCARKCRKLKVCATKCLVHQYFSVKPDICWSKILLVATWAIYRVILVGIGFTVHIRISLSDVHSSTKRTNASRSSTGDGGNQQYIGQKRHRKPTAYATWDTEHKLTIYATGSFF